MNIKYIIQFFRSAIKLFMSESRCHRRSQKIFIMHRASAFKLTQFSWAQNATAPWWSKRASVRGKETISSSQELSLSASLELKSIMFAIRGNFAAKKIKWMRLHSTDSNSVFFFSQCRIWLRVFYGISVSLAHLRSVRDKHSVDV